MKIILFIIILQIFNILCISLVYISLSRKTNAQQKKSSSCDKEQFKPFGDDYNDGIDIKTVKCSDVICSKAFDVSANITMHNTTDKDKEPNNENISMLLSKDGNISFKNTETNSIKSDATMNITSNKGMNVETSNGSLSIKSSSIVLPSSTLSNIKIGNTTLLNIMYPIGCIFGTADKNFRPATTFGGTWVNIAEEKSDGKNVNGYRFLVATNTTTGNGIGGSEYISVNNLPSHTHSFKGNTSTNGNHTHTYHVGCGESTTRTCCQRHTMMNNGWCARTTEGSGNHNHSFSGTTGGTGSGHGYWPRFYRIYYWKRTA